jgi:hypothetical protein
LDACVLLWDFQKVEKRSEASKDPNKNSLFFSFEKDRQDILTYTNNTHLVLNTVVSTMKRRQYWKIAALVTTTLRPVVADAEDYRQGVVPTQPCPLCGDGSNNVTDEYSSQFGGVGCNTFVDSANSVAEGSLECELLQLAAFQGECCETYYNDHQCMMCPSGNSGIAYPPRHVPSPHPESDLTNVNCNDLQTNATVQLEFLLQYFETPGVCNDTLLRRSAE